MGVYLIKNKVNGLIYIGKSTNCESRWRGEYNVHLTRAISKYGRNNFCFSVIFETSDPLVMDQAEEDLIHLAGSTDMSVGYNMSIGGGSGRRGIRHSDEFKEHLRKINTGKKMPREAVDRVAALNRGKKRSDEANEKNRQAKLGKKRPPFTEETKRRMSEAKSGAKNPMFGRDFTDEHRARLSAGQKKRRGV